MATSDRGSRWDSVRRRAEAAPLRLRLVALLIFMLIAVLAVTGIAATTLLRGFLLQRQDAELEAARTPLVNAALASEGTNSDTQGVPAYVPGGTYVVHLEWNSKNHTDVFSSTTDSVPNWPDLSPTSDALASTNPFTVDSETGDSRWRVIAGTTDSKNGPVTYAIAVSLNSIADTITSVQRIIIGTGIVVVLVSALAGWFGIRRAFRPLAQIEDTAAAIAAGDLTRRMPDPVGRDEIASLSLSLNAMLGRIEESFTMRERSEERMRQFVQDASHELRTPLATVRGYAELYRQGAVSKPEDVAAAVRRIEDEATRMSGMVDSLLLLNRLDEQVGGELPAQPMQEVDLTVLAGDAVQDARARDRERDIILVSMQGPVGPTVVRGNDAELRQVLANLVGNALRYSPEGSPIEVAVGSQGTEGIIEVRDHGPGIPPDQRDRIFERFYRADASRNSATGGSGLGLAIVAAIIETHQGTVRVRESPGGGATFTLRIPLLLSDA